MDVQKTLSENITAIRVKTSPCGWFLQKTHDLQKLGGELQAIGSDLVPRLKPLCNAMTEIYFTNRYPGFDLPSADWEEMRRWIQEVKELLLIVKARVQPPASDILMSDRAH